MLEIVKELELGKWAVIIGSLSLVLFFAVFLTVVVRYFLLPKASLNKMAMMPFDDDPGSEADSSLSPDHPQPQQQP